MPLIGIGFQPRKAKRFQDIMADISPEDNHASLGGREKDDTTKHHVEVRTDNGIEEQLLDLSMASAAAKSQLWTKGMFRLYCVMFIGYLCIVLQGFDGSLMGAINAMPQYQQYFGMCV
jgi:hypothetical protein